MPSHELGQYELEDDGTDLLIKDQSGNSIIRYDQSADKMELLKTIKSVNTEKASIDQASAKLTVADSSTLQSIADSASTKVNFNAVAHEPTNTDVFSVDAANSEITVNAAGEYILNFRVYWDTDTGWSTGDQISLRPYVNGFRETLTNEYKVSTDAQTLEFSQQLQLSAGDVIDCRVFQSSGASKDLQTGSGVASILFEFSIGRLG